MTSTAETAASPSNYSNIPEAPFAEDVGKLIQAGESPEQALQSFNMLLSKYRLMDAALHNRRSSLQATLEELEQSVQALVLLNQHANQALPLRYEMGSTLYGEATIPAAPDRQVGLWLGAGVMVQFETEEAVEFLRRKDTERREELRRVEHDVNFLRRQITTMEVNLARLYNFVLSLRPLPSKSK